MTESRSDRERRRQDKLDEYRILDTAREPVFDELAELAAQACDTPMAIVSLMDADRQWFKASVGLGISESPRNIAFCNNVIATGESMVIQNAAADSRFASNPFVTSSPYIRFYAGVPLLAPDGSCVGTLAVLDVEPRKAEAYQMRALEAFARLAMHAMELRLKRLALEDHATDKQQLIEALEKSRKLMEIAGRAARLGGWHVDLGARTMTWSDQVAVIHDEPPGTSPPLDAVVDYFAPEYRDRIRQVFDACASEGRPFDEEMELITATDRRIWVRSIGEPEYGQDGSIIGVQGAFHNITDRKRAEAALKHSEELYRHAAEASQAALWDYDMVTGKISFSEAFQHLLGYERIEDMPETFEAYMQLMHPEDQQRVRQKAKRLVAGETNDRATAEFRLLTPSGQYRWVQSNSKVIRDQQGRAIRRMGSTVDIHERRVAEQQLREQAERMRGILETATEAIITIDESGTIESANPATERIFGYRVEELLGRNVRMLMTEDQQHRHDDGLKRYMATGEARIIGTLRRLEAVHKDGRVFPIELAVSEMTLQGRRIFTGFIQDTTAEELARSALEASERRFRAVARATTDVIWELVMETSELSWSDGLEQAFGYTVEEAGNKVQWWMDRVHPDDREVTVSSLEAAFANRDLHWTAEYRFLHKAGHYAIVIDSAFIIPGEKSQPDRMIGGMKDVTEQRKAQQKLAEQAELLNKARDAIFVTDLDGIVTYWNRGAEQLYGWKTQEILGESIIDAVISGRSRWDRIMRKLLDSGGWDGQMRQRHRDDRERNVQCHLTLVLDKADRPKSVLAINTDMTEKLDLEEQLRQSQRLESIGQLTGGVAHDFNNLLTVILGNAELLSEALESNEELRSMAELTKSAASRGAELTNQLLSFARRQKLEPQPVDVLDLVNSMKPLLQRSLPEHIEITTSHEPGLWKAEIDPGQLESALLNLALNARDAMPRGGRLGLSISNTKLDEDYVRNHAEVQAGDFVQIAVTDTGEGIRPEIMKRLFEPFFTTKEKGRGTGLGLPMVYGFIKQSGGHIRVYSEVGIGTTVRMYLPRSENHTQPRQRAEKGDEAPRGTERVLVVEDDALVLHHVGHLIRQLGYDVTMASTGDEALELVRSGAEFDLLFTDVIMPGSLKGPDLAREVRRIHPDIRVLFTSGYTEDALTAEDLAQEPVRLLQKPYRKAALAQTLREVLAPREGK
jgi:PAS domain S-box-containing protein